MKYTNHIKWMMLLTCVMSTTSQNIQPIRDASTVTGGRDNKSCICVPYYLCDQKTNTTIMTAEDDGFGLLDARMEERQSCSDALEVCCFPSKQACGTRNVNDLSDTADDKDNAGLYEFPWTVAVLKNDEEKSSLCGSSLIHPQVLLTGAHCVKDLNATDILIRAGEWDMQTTAERLPHQEKEVARIISHPRYNPLTKVNDIALLILTDPVFLGDNINTICLPNEDENFDSAKQCVVNGWGKKHAGKNEKNSWILKKIILDVVSHALCQLQLRITRLGFRFILNNNFLCAGGVEGIDACEGDGGAALACPTSTDRYTQAGIVSWGIGCGEKDVPGVYTKVSNYRIWIDEEVTKAGYDTASYTFST